MSTRVPYARVPRAARVLGSTQPRWTVRKVSYYALVEERETTVIPPGKRKPRVVREVLQVLDAVSHRRSSPGTLRRLAVEMGLGVSQAAVAQRLHRAWLTKQPKR